ncbi:hypothetical protein [Thermosulfurimonas sp. F29]|uniref:hypothetical protein n=1 Tax=Thermosulfurimonas sp. F29 TaxID=2867247 RepID=UPI001C83566B|nr:hypothetical protein [Thermosulfurimonas sp. F29]MBX6424106.1 hypothetical protein [Thermosulfurimonas sp. F29]
MIGSKGKGLLTRMRKRFYAGDVERTIYRAEETAMRAGVGANRILEQYIRFLRASQPGLADALREVHESLNRCGLGNKAAAYRGFLPQEVTSLLRLAETKGLDTTKFLGEFALVRTLVEKQKRTVRAGLTVPVLMACLIAGILGAIAGRFKAHAATLHLGSVSVFIASHFHLIAYLLIGGMAFVFFRFPHRVPLLKRIYRVLDSVLVVGVINIMYRAGFSFTEIAPLVANQFNLGAVPSKAQALIDALVRRGILTPLEGADLLVALEYTKPEELLNILRDRKLEEAARISEQTGEVVKNVAILFSVIPIGLFLIVMFSVMMGAMSLIQ